MDDHRIDGIEVPDLVAIERTQTALHPYIRATPVVETLLPSDIHAVFKLEMLQVSGTFKARGAFSNLLGLGASQRAAGVTLENG